MPISLTMAEDSLQTMEPALPGTNTEGREHKSQGIASWWDKDAMYRDAKKKKKKRLNSAPWQLPGTEVALKNHPPLLQTMGSFGNSHSMVHSASHGLHELRWKYIFENSNSLPEQTVHRNWYWCGTKDVQNTIVCLFKLTLLWDLGWFGTGREKVSKSKTSWSSGYVLCFLLTFYLFGEFYPVRIS